MLRDMKLLSDQAPLALRVSSLAAVLAVTLAVAGIRPPGSSSSTQALAGQPSPLTANGPATSQDASALEAKYVPANALAVAVVRPSELQPICKQAMDKVGGTLSDNETAMLDLMSKCTSATLVIVSPDSTQGREPMIAFALSFSDKVARDAAAQIMGPGDNDQYQKEKVLLAEIEVQGTFARYFANDTTLVVGDVDIVKSMVVTGPSSLSALTQTEAWTAASKGTIAVAVDPAGIKTIMASAPPNPVVAMLSPFWLQADGHTLGITLREKVEMKLVSSSPDEKNAKALQSSITAAGAMLTGMVASQKDSVPESIKPAVETIEGMLSSPSVERTGNQTTFTISGDTKAQTDALVSFLVPAIIQAKQAAKRSQQQNNFKQIMLAMHNYNAAYGHFPPAVLIDADSGMKRSWRVELLPYVEHAELYNQYRKDQPWDSEANKAVLAKMPDVFRHPSMPEGSTNATIFAAIGKGLVFESDDKAGTQFRDITDGSSNTICIVEARRDIPWTKPEDIEMDLNAKKLPDLGFQPEGFFVGISDGSVRFISNSIDLQLWKALLTRAGGEVIN